MSSSSKSTGGRGGGRGAAASAQCKPGKCKSEKPGRRTSRVAFVGEEPGEDDPLLAFEPYRHKAPRSNSITPARQVRFVMALAATGIVTQAAREVGVSLEALYRLRAMPGAEGFAAAWEGALDRGMARLEDCALERAIEGEERVTYHNGKVVGRWRRYDTQLLIFLLRQRRPARFHDGRFIDRVEMERMHRAYREGLGAEAEAEAESDHDAIMASINARFDRMRAGQLVKAELTAQKEAGVDGGAQGV